MTALLLLALLQDGDWPMLAHDAAHTGYTAGGLEKPWKTRWRWIGEKVYALDEQPPEFNPVLFHRTAQPVLVEGILYLGALNGKLYAIRASDGQTLWSAKTGRQITHTACVVGPLVVVNGTDGRVHAFDRKSGAPAWTSETGAPLYSAPVAGDERIYVAGRDGFVHAFGTDGKAAWTAPVDDMILMSPAYAGGVVYVGTESARAWAVDAKDGSKLWETQLQGSSTRHVWPVVTKETVVFRTLPLHGSDVLFGALERIFKANAQVPWSELQPIVRKHLEDNPDHQTCFVLDRKTGKPRFTAPVGLISRHQDTPTPPVVAPDDTLYVNYRTNKTGSFKGFSFGTEFCPDIGILDLKSGDVRPFAPPGTYSSGVIAQCTDDACAFTMAGDWLIGAQNSHPGGRVGAIHVKDKREDGAIIARWNYDQQPFGGSWGPPNLYKPGQRVPVTDHGFNANIGMGYAPPIVVGDTLYATHVSGSVLVAIQGTRK